MALIPNVRNICPACAAVNWSGALAMSESGAGSDVVGSMSCRAELQGDHWLANGSKMWITNGPEADVLIVYMRTADKEAGSSTMTGFLVEKGMPGSALHKKWTSLACVVQIPANWCLKNCKIPR